MRSSFFSASVALLALACFAISMIFLPAAASAETIVNSEVSLAGNGQVIVRNAVVTAVQKNSITVKLSWGNAAMTWNVLTDGSTYFNPDSDKRIAAIKVGHIIDFSGALNGSSPSMSVAASYVKDQTLLKAVSKMTGEVLGYADGELTLKTESGTTSVAVGKGTIITAGGNSIAYSAIEQGAKLSVSGNLDTIKNTLSADRITLVSADSGMRFDPIDILTRVLRIGAGPLALIL